MKVSVVAKSVLTSFILASLIHKINRKATCESSRLLNALQFTGSRVMLSADEKLGNLSNKA
ncbi:hypothetical protein BSR55_04600 [Acinetobacter bereziniae]|nr:hypothetical protein BSR55_04600 [Acinetobacter bereziniae]